jgi:hypothetical protein
MKATALRQESNSNEEAASHLKPQDQSNHQVLKHGDAVETRQENTVEAPPDRSRHHRRRVVTNGHVPRNKIQSDRRTDALRRSRENGSVPTTAIPFCGFCRLSANRAGRTGLNRRNCFRTCIILSCTLMPTALTNRRCRFADVFTRSRKATVAKHQPLSVGAATMHTRQTGSQGEWDHCPHQDFPEVFLFA